MGNTFGFRNMSMVSVDNSQVKPIGVSDDDRFWVGKRSAGTFCAWVDGLSFATVVGSVFYMILVRY
jgi:hypothetical protein